MMDKLNDTMPCFLYVKQTNIFQCMLFMIFVCSLSCCMHNYFVLLLKLHLSCSCLEFFALFIACNWFDFGFDGACHLKNYSFITYLLEDGHELSLGMLDTSETYL